MSEPGRALDVMSLLGRWHARCSARWPQISRRRRRKPRCCGGRWSCVRTQTAACARCVHIRTPLQMLVCTCQWYDVALITRLQPETSILISKRPACTRPWFPACQRSFSNAARTARRRRPPPASTHSWKPLRTMRWVLRHAERHDELRAHALHAAGYARPAVQDGISWSCSAVLALCSTRERSCACRGRWQPRPLPR